MTAYYNEIDPFAAHVLRALIADGVIAPGDVDERSIVDVQPDDLKGYTQCHFFAGGGLWSVAARMAGWPDDKPLWTGSCPCQPLSVAGSGKGADDERHLWPAFFRLIAECAPSVVFGEQVASALGREWFAGVRLDLETLGYASGGADLCAAGIGAPQIRQRLYWVAMVDATRLGWGEGRPEHEIRSGRPASSGAGCSNLADADSGGRGGRPEASQRGAERGIVAQRAGGDLGDSDVSRPPRRKILPECRDENNSWSSGVEWRRGADGKSRRVKSGVCLLVDGLPGRVGQIRIAGNAIVPQVAATFINAAAGARP